jgi:hypothetical protein
MASGHASRINRPNTWLLRPDLRRTEKILANAEPPTHGTKRTMASTAAMSAIGGKADVNHALDHVRF